MDTISKRRAIILAAVAFVAASSILTYVLYPKDLRAALDRGYYGIARQFLAAEANRGDASAQNRLANLYYLGLGGERSYTRAFSWYFKSAAQVHSPAQVNVARMYRQGLGVKRDVLRAFAWLRQARINRNELAETQMRWLTTSLTLGPNQIQRARELYGELEDLVAGVGKKQP